MSKLDRLDPLSLASNPRATLSAWLKYEDITLTAFRMFPKPYVYTPTNMAANTVASRLRDAIRGKLAFDYPSVVDNTDLLRWYSEVIIKPIGKGVYIGKFDSVEDELKGQAETAASLPDLKFDDLTYEEVSAFALLISTQRLTGPVLVRVPPDVSTLPQRPNVEFILKPNGALVII